MPLWRIETDAEQDLVTLTYFEAPGSAPKECGRGELVLLNQLEAWVVEQAATWDRVQVGGAVFGRQASPSVPA